MNIVYFFGNGFDINMGLKTSYKDFIKEYLKSIINDKNHIVNILNVKTDLKKWSDVEIELGKLTKQFYENGYSGDDFAEFYTDISNSLCDYLAEEQRRFVITSINKDMCSSFLNGLLGYKNGLKQTEQIYINNIEKSIPGGYYVDIINFNYTDILSKLLDQCDNQMEFIGNRVYDGAVISNRINSIIYAHGNLKGDIVFGVDDENQISNLQLFENSFDGNKRVLIKREADTMIGQEYDRIAFEVLKKADLIYLYGISLGDTDKTWWSRIINHLEKNKNCVLIIYSYEFHKIYNERGIIQKEKMINDIKNKFLSYREYLIGEKIDDRIFVTGEDHFEHLSKKIRLNLAQKELLD